MLHPQPELLGYFCSEVSRTIRAHAGRSHPGHSQLHTATPSDVPPDAASSCSGADGCSRGCRRDDRWLALKALDTGWRHLKALISPGRAG
jgi:hypothetical protein